ncbi:MAG: glycosyltransferase [Vicinamibacterales bacterium]
MTLSSRRPGSISDHNSVEQKHLVSVITATRNRPLLLRQALQSIKQQSCSQFEVIVVDDGSNSDVQDQYSDIWADLDERFVLHRASPPDGPGSGPGRGRNVGLGLASGEYVAFLDHDDLWDRPDHLAVAVKALDAAKADYYFTHIRLEPRHPTLVGFTPPEELARCQAILTDPIVRRVPIADFVRVMQHYHIHPSHSVTRRQLFSDVGAFVEGLKTFDDINLMFRLADRARGILYRPDPVVAIRLPEGKSFSLASSELEQAVSAQHAMLDVRLRCVSTLIRRCARAREAWTLREISQLIAKERPGEASRLAWEALATFPSVGALWHFAATAARAVTTRASDQ